ncbi:hypothetical protein BD410DRAFT_396320 [Rickenella mellea]|uniref:Uncharacterized protein n=1 Tax=Rickenella mellea TaxID=50990 RepID=A0A4Y7PXK4_9AGAM|nr:hypothetical protein BD410DRAFT_396320 [Rickenella mellea]
MLLFGRTTRPGSSLRLWTMLESVRRGVDLLTANWRRRRSSIIMHVYNACIGPKVSMNTRVYSVIDGSASVSTFLIIIQTTIWAFLDFV